MFLNSHLQLFKHIKAGCAQICDAVLHRNGAITNDFSCHQTIVLKFFYTLGHHAFAEPALFVINEYGTVQVVDYSNNPFVRPELATLVRGLKWVRKPDNNYPIRGTYPDEQAVYQK